MKKQEVRATQTKEINRGFLVLWWDGVLKKTRPNIASRHLVWKSEKKNRRNMIRKTQNQTYKKWTTLSMSTLNHNFTKLKKKEKRNITPLMCLLKTTKDHFDFDELFLWKRKSLLILMLWNMFWVAIIQTFKIFNKFKNNEVKRSIFQTFWKEDCCAKFLFFELEN